MNDEELLLALGKLARAQAAAEPTALFEAAEGRPGGRAGSEGSDGVAPLLAAPPPERLDALAALALEKLGRAEPAAIRAPAIPAVAPRRRTRISWLVGGAALALAGLVLVLGGPRSSSPLLPPYDVEVTGGATGMRGPDGNSDPAAPIALRPGATLELSLRPRTPYGEPVGARVFLVTGEHETIWSAMIEVAPSGALQLIGTVPAAPASAPAGVSAAGRRGELWIVVGRPNALPAHAPVNGAPSGVRVLRRAIVWP